MFVIFVFRVQVVIKVVIMLAAGRMFLLLSKHEYVDNTMLGVHNSHTHVSYTTGCQYWGTQLLPSPISTIGCQQHCLYVWSVCCIITIVDINLCVNMLYIKG